MMNFQFLNFRILVSALVIINLVKCSPDTLSAQGVHDLLQEWELVRLSLIVGLL